MDLNLNGNKVKDSDSLLEVNRQHRQQQETRRLRFVQQGRKRRQRARQTVY
jgi:hypothetical protein